MASIFDDRPWLKNYPNGVPANIDPQQYDNVLRLMQESFEKFDRKVAFSSFDVNLTYRELDRKSTQMAAYLQSRGLQAGDRIALMMPNLLQYPIAIIAALKAGLVIVNTNPLYTCREMEHQFTCSGVKAIIIAENFADKLQQILSNTEINTVITTSIGELLGAVKGRMVNFAVKYVKRMVPSFKIINAVSFKEALKIGKKFEWVDRSSGLEDVILHQYTGGTTGVSKGAMLTNKNILANMLQIHAWMLGGLQPGEEVALCPLPMYHVFAFTVHGLAVTAKGFKNILIVNPRDLNTLAAAFKRYPISVMTGVNTLYNALNHHDKMKELDYSRLKVCVAGGMALQNSVADSWKAMTGCPIAEGYGLSETSPVAMVNPIDGSGVPSAVGLPVPSTTVRIVDDNGQVVGIDEVGEICIQGPQVMMGYYGQPEESASALRDGWFYTGDIGKMIDGGYFMIVDRKKDMINVSGFNVFPNEIEAVLTEHPGILEAAVIGVPDEKSGELVKAFIVKKDRNLQAKEIEAYAREQLTAYKVPKQIEFRDELPKTNVGKILRKELRK